MVAPSIAKKCTPNLIIHKYLPIPGSAEFDCSILYIVRTELQYTRFHPLILEISGFGRIWECATNVGNDDNRTQNFYPCDLSTSLHVQQEPQKLPFMLEACEQYSPDKWA
jgi:hypothetical protein